MAQQINLYSPILLQPRRMFSARTMLQALGALLAGLVLLGAWVEYSTTQQRRELAATTAAQTADRQRLQAELAKRPATPKDNSALEQELVQARQAVADRQHLLGELTSPQAHASRAAVLRLIAQTAPDQLWLTDVRLADGRLDLAGTSLQPEQLRPWFAHLLAQPALQGLVLRSVAVDAADGARDAPDARAMAWSFRLSAQTRPDDSAAAPPAREGKP